MKASYDREDPRRLEAADLLVVLRARGVRLWSDEGRLKYQAPQGTLTRDDLTQLAASKADLLALLERRSGDEALRAPITPRQAHEPVPLTFTQQFWWTVLQLHSRPSMRSVAGAVRLKGQLDVAQLRECVAELVRRHESLRTRIVVTDGVPWQVIDEPPEDPLAVTALEEGPSEAHTVQIAQLVERMVHQRFSVSTGPLFLAQVIRVGEDDHVLVVALDHLIADAASLGIIWQEILALYARSLRGLPCSLPQKPLQFSDYAVWQRRTDPAWRAQHEHYWRTRLSGARRARALEPDALPQRRKVGWGRQGVQFGQVLSRRLRALGRERKTSLALVILAAYGVFLLRCAHATDLTIAFITLGRPHPELDQTIGYFGTALFLRFEVVEGDSFLKVLDRLREEYSTAYQHSDEGRVTAETPTPEFIWNPRFNWIPEALTGSSAEDLRGGLDTQAPLKIEPYGLEVLPREDIAWEGEFEWVASDTKEGVSGFITYRVDRFSASSMEHFVRRLESFTAELIAQPEAALP